MVAARFFGTAGGFVLSVTFLGLSECGSFNGTEGSTTVSKLILVRFVAVRGANGVGVGPGVGVTTMPTVFFFRIVVATPLFF